MGKKMYELDQINEEAIKSDETALKNLEVIRKDHNRALLKQKQMVNDIELIQMNILSEQQKDDQRIHQLEKLRADNQKQLENQRHHDEKLDELKEAVDTMNTECDIDFEEKMRLVQ